MRAAILIVALVGCTHVQRMCNVPAPPPTVREHVKHEAISAYVTGETWFYYGAYELAIDNFKRAFDLRPRPEIAFNLALAERRRGNPYAAWSWLKVHCRMLGGKLVKDTPAYKLANTIGEELNEYEEAFAEEPEGSNGQD
jgi:hypothetical protein